MATRLGVRLSSLNGYDRAIAEQKRKDFKSCVSITPFRSSPPKKQNHQIHAEIGERTTLSGNHATFLERTEQQLKIWLLEQALCWSFWVGGVGDDHIKLVLVVIQELETISDVGADFRVFETDGHAWKVLLGETDNCLYEWSDMSQLTSHNLTLTHLINVAEDCFFNTFMFNDLTQDTAITSANDQDLLWVGVRIHGQMGNHLLVCKLVPLSALDDIVKNQDGAVVAGFEDEDILIFALLVVDDILHLESHGLARPHLRDLAEPAICGGRQLLALMAVEVQR